MKITINTTKIIIITLIALLLSSLHVMAQNVNYEIKPDIPPNPQATAFNRLGDYQVDNNYGMPDISIPLFEIDYHGYKIPLTLHYEATPMKPGYNYDVTGYGWTLSGNSCVSRTIKDIADECANTPFTLDGFQLSSGADKEYLYYLNNNLLDYVNYQYDSYNIVLPSGRNIPFLMYKIGGVMQYKLISVDIHVKIVCNYSTNTINSFTVTDENGVIYHFTLPEKATNIIQSDPNADRNVTWLLTSIDIPAKGTIYYQYTDNPVVINTHNILREPVVTVCRLYANGEEWLNESRFKVKGSFQSQSPRYEMKFLKCIIYGPAKVNFNYKTDNQHMEEIVVSNNNETIRKFTLNVYGGLGDDAWHLNSLIISGQNNEDNLKYTFTYSNNNAGNYTDFWGNRCNAGPSVTDNYGNTLNNYGLDDLGNFNLFFAYDGVNTDWTSLQTQISSNGRLAQLIENEPGDHSYYYKLKLQTTTAGDTRIPTAPNNHGVLTSITYPNGGITIFNWENHRFPTATAADGDIVYDRRSQRIIEGGGFRIESIKNYTADGSIACEDYYRYGYTLGDIIHRNFPLPMPDNFNINDTINHHIGCGEAVVDPNLFTFMSGFSYSRISDSETFSTSSYLSPTEFRKMLLGEDSQFKNLSNSLSMPRWWEATFSANKFRSLIGGRKPVVYPEITVYHGQPYDTDECKSKTVYRYDIYKPQFPDYNTDNNYLLTSNQPTGTDTAYFEPLIFWRDVKEYPALSCIEHPADRHQLKSKSDYSYNSNNGKWEIVSEENYKYNNHNTSEYGYIFESYISRENYYPNYEGLSYNQMGYTHPLLGVSLSYFYKPSYQYFGRSTMTKKSTTTLRQGGTRSWDNTQDEVYSYLYQGVLKSQEHSDIMYGIVKWYTNGCDKKTEYTYIGEDESNSDSVIVAMKSRNMLAFLVSTETFTFVPWESKVAGSKIDYASFDGNFLPYKFYESNGEQYEESMEVISYDSFGNPTEIEDLKTGIHTVFLWDNYGRYLVAMIKDATLAQVQNIYQLMTVSSPTRHSMLQTQFPNAQIQTWDYKPLVGVSSHTDVNGQTLLYEYDGLGRLIKEKRVVNGIPNPEILHEYEYNFLNQQ